MGDWLVRDRDVSQLVPCRGIRSSGTIRQVGGEKNAGGGDQVRGAALLLQGDVGDLDEVPQDDR